jgi:glycosyltransferase involved in cell wall biosynthesis
MKICHVITRMIVGGAQENTLLTAKGLHEKGHEVVLVTGPSPGPEGELLRQGDAPKFETVVCPDLVRELSPLHDWRAFRFLKDFYKERKFDVVHTHSSKAGIVGRLAGRAAGTPLVVHTVHGLAFHRYESKLKNAIYIASEMLAARSCDRIYSVAQAMIDQCLAAHVGRKEQFKVVYSGMELDKFLNAQPDPELKRRLKIPEGRPVIGTVARLFPLKGYEQFIPAAIRIAAMRPDVHFLIVGDGVLRPELESSIAACGLSGNFSFAGLVPPSEVCRYTALMDVLVHLSLREGLPRAAVQALATSKPVVAYSLDGTPEVVRNGETGFCVEPENVDSVVFAVNKLLSDPEQAAKMGRAGRALVSELFDWRRMADVLERDYFDSLAAKRR